MRRLFVLLFVIAVAIAAAGCQKQEAKAQTETAPPPLPSDVVAVAPIADKTAPATGTIDPAAAIEAEGKLVMNGEFVSPVVSEVAPKVPGRVARVHVNEGDRVAAGARLLDLETEYARLDVDRAQADLARARAALDEARRDFDRKSELRQKDSIPQATFDRSRALFEQAQAAHGSASAAVAMARQRLADMTVVSPFNGVVVERRTDAGERLQDNTVAFVIAQTAPLKLRFWVPERYATRVERGEVVRASVDAYPGKPFDGTVSTVAQVIDPKTRSFFVEAVFPNRDGALKPGMFARVELDLN